MPNTVTPSLPTRERELKRLRVSERDYTGESLPTRERELKLGEDPTKGEGHHVAPYTGA